ncbi:MAG: sulfite exporter TauE/SafE family protein [Puniceicoccales bacterium]|jgi:uncharacterized membrane protein YfcA|nr:sulfite exporter TauE/SafE family protein [Puniceicoccales bacterium]
MQGFETWQWVLLFAASLLVGISKTGIPGLGILFVALFANVFEDGRQATGLVLPLLIAGDLFAVAFYRRHMEWRWLVRLFPWAAAGVVAGFLAMGRMNDRQSGMLIGGIILAFSAAHFLRERRGRAAPVAGDSPPPGGGMPPWFCPVIGLLMGFTTLVANAAGPLATLFFLAAGLPKMEFVGTGAVFFMVLNWFKVPFMAGLGLITVESLGLNAMLVPAVFTGAIAGRLLLRHVNQRLFENIALALGVLAGLRLLLG